MLRRSSSSSVLRAARAWPVIVAFVASFLLLLTTTTTTTTSLVHARPVITSHAHGHPHAHAHDAGSVEVAPSKVDASSTVTVDLSKPLLNVSQSLWGIFFEEINHAGVGGLYYEQIRNSNFEEGQFTSLFDPWTLLAVPSGVSAFISLNQDMPLTPYSPYSIYVRSSGGSGTVGIYNPGFWGISTVGIKSYTVSFWAYATSGFSQTTTLTASIVSNTTETSYGSVTFNGIGSTWQQFTATLMLDSSVSDPQAGFTLSWPTTNTTVIYFDVVSVIPDNGWNGLPYIRPDLGQMVADLHPAFMRFPGGCYVEGDKLMDRFNWKNTLGPRENRRGHNNLWGYYSEDYLGIFEYFSFVEKLTDVYGNPTRAIWVINNGISHTDEIPTSDIGFYVQDALDSIEFIRGDTSTYYGALRAAMGHPAPFTSLAFMAIGNEDCGRQYYNSNYQVFYQALSSAYPDITLIANCDLTGSKLPTQLWDYHMYNNPEWFIANQNTFDTWPRSGAKIFNSEYAVTTGAANGNAIAAIAEAVWMNGLERNSDLVTTASYAPLFVNVNNRAWTPDAIDFDSSQVYGTPSYWTQYLYANAYWGANAGTVQTLSSSAMNPSGAPMLFAAATWGQLNATVSGQYGASLFVCVKVVNVNSTAASATVSFANVPSGATFLKTVEVLTIQAQSEQQENSFSDPTAVAPVASQLQLSGSSFTYEFPALSITRMRFYANV